MCVARVRSSHTPYLLATPLRRGLFISAVRKGSRKLSIAPWSWKGRSTWSLATGRIELNGCVCFLFCFLLFRDEVPTVGVRLRAGVISGSALRKPEISRRGGKWESRIFGLRSLLGAGFADLQFSPPSERGGAKNLVRRCPRGRRMVNYRSAAALDTLLKSVVKKINPKNKPVTLLCTISFMLSSNKISSARRISRGSSPSN